MINPDHINREYTFWILWVISLMGIPLIIMAENDLQCILIFAAMAVLTLAAIIIESSVELNHG